MANFIIFSVLPWSDPIVWPRPLAVVYIGGFFFAILLRLFVVPVLYETLAGISGREPLSRA